MAFTKIAAAGIGSTGTVTLQNIIVTGSVNTPSITGAASTENVRTNSLVVSGVTTSSGGFVGNVTGNATGLSGTPNITVGSIIASSATISGNVSVAGTVTYEDVTNVDSVGVVTARSDIIVGAGLSVVGVTTLASAGGITTAGGTLFAKQLNISGVSTFGNTVVVGGATTQLIVNGNARITGIFTVGTSSLTFDGNANTIAGLSTITGSTNYSKPNLANISSTISSTATDVFVYDTRKDSDGGQWRKRTQHTSWYNETLNTATRGSRREFPAVAVIVATAYSVTIYDGDDPDMPMWMVFESSGYGMSGVSIFNANSVVNSSVYALNGILVGGQTQGTDTYGSPIINFISEKVVRMDPNSSEGGLWLGNIATRNTTAGYASQASSGQGYLIVDSRINDVAMTVLPNAPIDSATGLPIPTIAVATNGGVSVIKDDGSVVNSTSNASYSIKRIDIKPTGELFHQQGSGSNEGVCYNFPFTRISGVDLGTYANSSTFWYASAGIGNSSNYLGNSAVAPTAINAPTSSSLNIGDNRGLTIVSVNNSSLNNGMVAYATTSYNTGWMHGDIKGAWLSDTSTASVTGTELVTNGTFTSNVTGWTAQNSATVAWQSGTARIRVTAGAPTNGAAYQQITTVAGQRYTISYDAYPQTANTNYGQLYIRDGSASGTVIISSDNTTQTSYSHTFVATSTSTFIVLYGSSTNTNGNYAEWDNISMRIAESDRSVNNKGLQVFGTITKSVVATGSNLVAYSGFSASNYLQQPYNSALDFGTGDFCVMGWINTTDSTTNIIMSKSPPSSITSPYFEFQMGGGNVTWVHTSGGGALSFGSVNSGTWRHLVYVRSSGVGYGYKDGVSVGSHTNTGNYSHSNTDTLRFGYRQDSYSGAFLTGSLALWRISSTVPSPTQIAKIYNDEKALFQPNSQCTLYGSSDAVTALAYDDTTKLLSVGTSSGRSDFQGLERINNTTTAVTTAISASNGLIAEQ